jgi:hypothetical protein
MAAEQARPLRVMAPSVLPGATSDHRRADGRVDGAGPHTRRRSLDTPKVGYLRARILT